MRSQVPRSLFPLLVFLVFAAPAAAEPLCWTGADGAGYRVNAPADVALSIDQQARIARILDRRGAEADDLLGQVADLDDALDAGGGNAAALQSERDAAVARVDSLDADTRREIAEKLTPRQRDYLRTHSIGPCVSEPMPEPPAPAETRVEVYNNPAPVAFVFGGLWLHHEYRHHYGYWGHSHRDYHHHRHSSWCGHGGHHYDGWDRHDRDYRDRHDGDRQHGRHKRRR